MSPTGYRRFIMPTLEDLEGEEIIAYSWHPYGASPVRYPHLHLEHGARIGRPELIGAHLPYRQGFPRSCADSRDRAVRCEAPPK